MPNNVTNILEIHGKDAHKVMIKFLNKEGFFDFNKILPVPSRATRESIWGTKWNAYNQSFPIKYPNGRYKFKKQFESGYIQQIETSYRKRVIKKRQKRNKITSCQFETAWRTPKGVWVAMIGQIPSGITVSVKFASEDTGSHCGQFCFISTGIVSHDIAPEWSKMSQAERRKWSKFAFEITNTGEDPGEYGHY